MDRTQILWANETEWPAGWQLYTHSHSYFQLYYLHSGTAQMTANNVEYLLHPGDFLIFPPNTLHGIHQKNRGLCSFYELRFQVFDPDFLGIFESGSAFWGQQSPQLEIILERIVALHKSAHPNMIALLDILMSAFLCLIDNKSVDDVRSNYFDTSNYSLVVKKTIKQLELNFADPYNLSALSSSLGFNKSYLCSQFQKETGVSISTCLHYIRIRHVLGILYCNRANAAFKINMASQYAGFADSSNFNRIFKKMTGLTPSQFINSMHEDHNQQNWPLIQYYNLKINHSDNGPQRKTVLNSINTLKGLGEHFPHQPLSTN